jgi:hypothetical protein
MKIRGNCSGMDPYRHEKSAIVPLCPCIVHRYRSRSKEEDTKLGRNADQGLTLEEPEASDRLTVRAVENAEIKDTHHAFTA